MPINRQAAPQGATDLIRDAIANIEGTRESLLGAGPSQEMSEPVPLYTIDIEALGQRSPKGHLLDSMILAGWRSIVTSSEGHRVADLSAQDEDLRFARLVAGPRVDDMISAAQVAETFVADSEYEFRILESPRLKIGAIWLSGDQSQFVPFAGLPMRLFDEQEFMKAITARAPAAPGIAVRGMVIASGAIMVSAVVGFAARLRRSRQKRVAGDDDESGGTTIVG
jgi:hypothetical protein